MFGVHLGAEAGRIEYPNASRLAKAISIFITARRTGVYARNITSRHLTGSRAFSPAVQQGLKIHGNRDSAVISIRDESGCLRVYIKDQIRRAVTHSFLHIDLRFVKRCASAAASSTRCSLRAS
jgi:hypothetical protein